MSTPPDPELPLPVSSVLVYRVAVPVPIPGLFDYLPGMAGPDLVPGCRVVVRFGRRRLVGVIMGRAHGSEVPEQRLQPVLEVLDDGLPMLQRPQLQLLSWCARYYKHPIGEVVFNALPPALRRSDGQLPAPPFQYRITTQGLERLGEGPGRASAQFRLLEAMQDCPLTPAALRQEVGATAALLRILEEQRWIQREPLGAGALREGEAPTLTSEQQAVCDALQQRPDAFTCHLLDGVTGSGKTEVYLQLIQQALDRNEQVLILVPEIGLIPQLLRRIRRRFGIEPHLTHSAMASVPRMETWAAALSGEARILLGTRSALFLPLTRPGLMVLDEAHDASFKQQDGFRYSAADVAVKRAQMADVPVVLGTATPNLEMLHNAAGGRYQHHRLTQRATGARAPGWRVVDLRRQPTQGGLSSPAMTAMEETLARDEQVLVFLNRRGYAPVLLCHECGWHAGCRHCDANLTWHRASRRLHCHHCGAREPAPHLCPDCRADALRGAGEGTEQLETHLQRAFPEVEILRVDRDRVQRKGALEAVVETVRSGDPCILVGTQMLAKGHHFPRVTLVVVVDLDQALYSADFRAIERMGQVLTQVAGRAGRDDRPGTVILQTHHPEHERVQSLRERGFEAFARELLEERAMAGLPPFSFQATLRAEARERERVLAFLRESMALWTGPGGTAFGPMPAMMERRGDRLRWYLLFQTDTRAALQSLLDCLLPQVRLLKSASGVRWAIDLDPQEF